MPASSRFGLSSYISNLRIQTLIFSTAQNDSDPTMGVILLLLRTVAVFYRLSSYSKKTKFFSRKRDSLNIYPFIRLTSFKNVFAHIIWAFFFFFLLSSSLSSLLSRVSSVSFRCLLFSLVFFHLLFTLLFILSTSIVLYLRIFPQSFVRFRFIDQR
jgi:hypothetical protein